jgi:hypothetical protein
MGGYGVLAQGPEHEVRRAAMRPPCASYLVLGTQYPVLGTRSRVGGVMGP